MSKEQQRKKFQHKQKQKQKEIPPEKRVGQLLSDLGESPDATGALKKALQKTMNEGE